jgi:hypothetical protein
MNYMMDSIVDKKQSIHEQMELLKIPNTKQVKINYIIKQSLLFIIVILLYNIKIEKIWPIILILLGIYLYNNLLYNYDIYNEKGYSLLLLANNQDVNLDKLHENLVKKNKKKTKNYIQDNYIICIIPIFLILLIIGYSYMNLVINNYTKIIEQIIEQIIRKIINDPKISTNISQYIMTNKKYILDKFIYITKIVTSILIILAIICGFLVIKYLYKEIKKVFNISIFSGLILVFKYIGYIVAILLLVLAFIHILLLLFNFNNIKIIKNFIPMISDKDATVIMNKFFSYMYRPCIELFAICMLFIFITIGILSSFDIEKDDILSLIKVYYLNKDNHKLFKTTNIVYLLQFIQYLSIFLILLNILEHDDLIDDYIIKKFNIRTIINDTITTQPKEQPIFQEYKSIYFHIICMIYILTIIVIVLL